MGGSLSIRRRREQQEGAVSREDALMELERQPEDVPSEGQSSEQPTVPAVVELEHQQGETPLDGSEGHEHTQPADLAEDALAEQEHRQGEEPSGGTEVVPHRAAGMAQPGVRRLLSRGSSVQTAYEFRQTPLIAAASAGAEGLCTLLIDAGADLGARGSCGRTALHAAAEAESFRSAAVVELLLRHGADRRARDGRGRTALHCALQTRNLKAAEALMPAAGQPLLADDTGRTELHWAAANGSPDAVRRLAALAGEDARATDGAGMSPLALALQARNRLAAAALLPLPEDFHREPTDLPDAFGRTELHWAAIAGYSEVVGHLLERGYCPWAADLCRRDSLMWAVDSSCLQAVAAILAVGYRECVDGHGQTALHVAAARGDEAAVARLLERGADPSRLDAEGRSPLALALRGGHRDAAFLLALRDPPNLRWRDADERTLLHWAAAGGDVDAVSAFLAHGADVNAMDAQRKTPAALAVDHGHEAAAAVLVDAPGFQVVHDQEGRTALHGAAAAGWRRVCERLVARGADPHEGGYHYLSPVMLASRAGHNQLARYIARARWISQ